MTWFLRQTFYAICLPFTIILVLIVQKSNSVIFYCSSRQAYNDNTRYIFENLREDTEISAYWLTDNDQVKKHIENAGGKTVSTKRPLSLLWRLLRAKVIVDIGDGKFDPFWIASLKNVTAVSTMHGSGPKATLGTGKGRQSPRAQIKRMNKFDYVNFPSDFAGKKIGEECYELPKHKIINMGYPRCDQLILARKDPLGERPRLMCSQFVKDISANSRVILYTPTWRPYSYKLPLLEMPGFSLEKFENWLAREDAYFFITTHSANPPNHAPYSNQRFQVLSNLQRPLFDVSMFMTEADLLVNDYSTTSVDFALTQRPQIFFMPDYDLYQKEKGFIEFYKDCLVGPEVSNYDDFTEKLLMALKEPNVFESEFSLKKKVLLQKYYTSTTSNSTGRWTAFIKALCSNSR